MKYNTLKATFKNGMVSPRLRGREKEGEITSSVEKIENFIVDKVGGAVKRGGIQLPQKQPFLNAGDGVARYEANPVAAGAPIVMFNVVLRGREVIFRFDLSKKFNDIVNGSPTTVAHYQSTYLRVIDPLTGDLLDCRTFAPARALTASHPTINRDLSMWNTQGADPLNSTKVATYLNTLTPSPSQMVKVSDSTVVFSCGNSSISEHNISFTVSLLDLPVSQATQDTSKVYVVLPYFVNVRAFVANLGKDATDTAYLNPILPLNFPFNPVNTNKALRVASLVSSGFGTTIADSVLSVPSNDCQAILTIPYSMCKDSNEVVNTATLLGKFISIPDASNIRDCVFFLLKASNSTTGLVFTGSISTTTLTITAVISGQAIGVGSVIFGTGVTPYTVVTALGTGAGGVGTYTVSVSQTVASTTMTVDGLYSFTALQITGGTPETNSTRWKVSTFGGRAHPRAVGYCFGRLMYGNAGIEQSKWWASGVHPSNVTNFQGFLGFSLAQDATSDVSGMLNEGIATPTISDQFRYGFVGQVPNLAAISFIESRRRIHFGTTGGECQLTIGNSGFAKYSYEEYIVRSNNASLYQATRGDGKIFYIANYGRDIRFISTEDRDYESIDGLLTTALEGIDLIFNKILWSEKLSAVIARTSTNRIFIITLHEDTQIKAITEFTSILSIVDFSIAADILYFTYTYGSYTHTSKYLVDELLTSSVAKESSLGGDLGVFYPSLIGELDYTDMYPFFVGSTIYIYFEGAEYSVNIPLAYNGVASTITLPIDLGTATVSNPAFFYGKKVTAKIKTMPISEGGGNDSAVGDVTRVDRVLIQVDNSGPFRVGNEGGTIYDAEGVQLSPLSTKYVKYDMPQSPDIENHLYIETDKPTPLNISGVAYRGVSNNGA